MEEKINKAAILKDKPKGTKLYDLLRNIVVELDKVHITDVGSYIECTATNEVGSTLMFNYSKLGTEVSWLDGLQILLPSKLMRDWSKFTWKKGDVLQKNSRTHVIFDSFVSDTYEVIRCKYFLKVDNGKEIFVTETNVFTNEYFKASEEQRQCYINKIEEHFGGKLNLETLEIEKSQLEFKDGDILYAESNAYHYPSIHILNTNCDTRRYYARLVINGTYDEAIDYDIPAFDDDDPNRLRLATEEEVQQLFDALAKEGKCWDADKKEVVALKSLWTPKPFDRVITRNAADDVWTANIFSHMDSHGEYVTIACVGGYTHCLPYNKKTAKLIGTTNNWEG